MQWALSETAFPYSVIELDKVPSNIVLVCLHCLYQIKIDTT
jgi:hypothetical protein